MQQQQGEKPCAPLLHDTPCLHALGRRRCREAIEALSHLPINHYQTGWVLNQVGRANFELVDYPEAAKTFQWARQVDPYRLEVSWLEQAG